MRKQERLGEPAALRDGATQWTATWIGKQNEKKPWRWPVKDGYPINQLLLEPLRKQTASHCSFCDGFPVAAQNCSAWSLLGRNFFCRVIQISAGTVRFDLFLFARGPLEGQDR